jgi:hypothetical protein
MWDAKLKGFRLKKKNNGSRYTQDRFHRSETTLVKLLEDVYGKSNVFTSYHPEWAITRKRVLYEFDVYIPSKKLLIEYNGRQHYERVRFFHKTESEFKRQQFRDKAKEALAIVNNHRLIVFKYDEPITKNYIRSKLSQ